MRYFCFIVLGISDATERKRLWSFALDFERLGDQALQFETQRAAASTHSLGK